MVREHHGEHMAHPDFEDLPFNVRPDLTPYLVHLTKNTKEADDFSAFDNLVHILEKGEIWGSSTKKGFIKGPNKATCFMDVPFSAMKYVLNPTDTNPVNPRYEPYGIVVTKKYAYRNGCRPVLYLSNKELSELNIPKDHRWRVVRFERADDGWISWIHEREWRCRGHFDLPERSIAVLVKTTRDAEELTKRIQAKPKKFATIPASIIPLSVICQGFPKH